MGVSARFLPVGLLTVPHDRRDRLRLHPASPQTERVALQDDVIPLAKPVRLADGKTVTSIRVETGQVRTPSLELRGCRLNTA